MTHPPRTTLPLLLLTLAAPAGPARALGPDDDARAQPTAARVEAHARVGAGLFGGHAAVGARLVWPSRLSLGVEATGAYGTWFVGGLEGDRATTTGGQLTLELPLVSDGPRHVEAWTTLGARSTLASGLEGAPRSVVGTLGVGLRATAEVADPLDLHMGVGVPVALAFDPAVELEQLGQFIEFGGDVWLGSHVALGAAVRAGGDYGYDGDGPKASLQGTLGVKVALDARPDAAPARPRDPSAVAVFIATEWRMLGLADHLSHGPAFSAGVALFDRHLKVGLTAMTRPGALNGVTFATATVDGQTYRGRQTLDLRSDGGFVGLVVAPVFDLPFFPALSVELPLAIGQGAYGFYLPAKDRVTPDGRRVSAWEDQLFGGRDSSPALNLEAGLKLAVRFASLPGLTPYAAFRYTWAVGFDTLVRTSYDGPSGALGLEFTL